MTPWRPIIGGVWIVAGAMLVLLGMQSVDADSVSQDRRRKMTIELTDDFYRALRNEGTKTFSTDPQDEYLRQIAVSTKFMVETNLRIIEQQARMIELLEKRKSSP
jgi:hypothetical protein